MQVTLDDSRVPRKRVLELSCGVRSPQQVPWWNADRRARSAEREPHPLMRRLDYCACRRSACLLFVEHDPEKRTPVFRKDHAHLRCQSTIEPKAGATAG
jgi:hypothetical protein